VEMLGHSSVGGPATAMASSQFSTFAGTDPDQGATCSWEKLGNLIGIPSLVSLLLRPASAMHEPRALLLFAPHPITSLSPHRHRISTTALLLLLLCMGETGRMVKLYIFQLAQRSILYTCHLQTCSVEPEGPLVSPPVSHGSTQDIDINIDIDIIDIDGSDYTIS
jgi:hypothetical protein